MPQQPYTQQLLPTGQEELFGVQEPALHTE
jgi:hypothetical protein